MNITVYPWNKDNVDKLKIYEKELRLSKPNLPDWKFNHRLRLEWRRLEYIEQEKVEKERELVFFKVTLPLYNLKIGNITKEINALDSYYHKKQNQRLYQWEQHFCDELLKLKLKHRKLQNKLRKICHHQFTPFYDLCDYLHNSTCIYCQLSGKELYESEFNHN